jgi:uncharacterized protein YprB with RNaseH-like and TPR domain
MKVLFTDTESTDLAASWGHILCASFATLEGDPYTFRGDTRPYKGRRVTDDARLVKAIRQEWESADILVTWNGILHDVPLVNARLSLANERGIQIGTKHGSFHLDAMYYAGGQSLKIGGRKLDTVARFFKTPSQKTPLDGAIWQDAAAGEKQAMDQIAEHCEYDTLVLRELWPHLAPYVKKVQFNLSEVWPFVDQIPSRKGD